jgi:hypothetical protein
MTREWWWNLRISRVVFLASQFVCVGIFVFSLCSSFLSHKKAPLVLDALNFEPLPTLVYMNISWVARRIDTWLVGIDHCWMDITFLWYLSNKDIQLGLSLNIGYQLFFKNSNIWIEYHIWIFKFDLDINMSNINHYLLIKYHYQISYTPIEQI